MKKTLLLLGLTGSFAFGQNAVNITTSEYNQLKQAGQVNQNTNYHFTDLITPENVQYVGAQVKAGLCDCMVPLDSTFTLAMQPNDDGSSALINLPFNFDYYGNMYNSLYINNNGNISFLAPYITFTPNPFPDASYNMIAPFWADVDTRLGSDTLGNPVSGGEVWYKITPNYMIVKWEQVGYFATHTDLLSTFQLIISDGTDPIIGAGGNVAYCYGDMAWTTGDASSGSGGFGGAPATVGVNYGNGVDYFQVGQFDQPGIAFDGPVNNNDGVDFLDGQEVYFNIAGAASTNTPPLILNSSICDTIDVYTGDTLKSMNAVDFSFTLMTPEMDQVIQTSFTTDAPAGAFSYQAQALGAEVYNVDASFDATGVPVGIYSVIFTAVDNGIPVGMTSQEFIFEVFYDASLNTNGVHNLTTNFFELYPNPTENVLNITMKESLDHGVLKVRDISGKVLFTANTNDTTSIDLTNYTSGMYFVSIESNGSVIGTQKVIKK